MLRAQVHPPQPGSWLGKATQQAASQQSHINPITVGLPSSLGSCQPPAPLQPICTHPKGAWTEGGHHLLGSTNTSSWCNSQQTSFQLIMTMTYLCGKTWTRGFSVSFRSADVVNWYMSDFLTLSLQLLTWVTITLLFYHSTCLGFTLASLKNQQKKQQWPWLCSNDLLRIDKLYEITSNSVFFPKHFKCQCLFGCYRKA